MIGLPRLGPPSQTHVQYFAHSPKNYHQVIHAGLAFERQHPLQTFAALGGELCQLLKAHAYCFCGPFKVGYLEFQSLEANKETFACNASQGADSLRPSRTSKPVASSMATSWWTFL